jgi:hypothetical protein
MLGNYRVASQLVASRVVEWLVRLYNKNGNFRSSAQRSSFITSRHNINFDC